MEKPGRNCIRRWGGQWRNLDQKYIKLTSLAFIEITGMGRWRPLLYVIGLRILGRFASDVSREMKEPLPGLLVTLFRRLAVSHLDRRMRKNAICLSVVRLGEIEEGKGERGEYMG